MYEILKIRDKDYPVRIGYHVMKSVQAKLNMTFEQALQEAEKDITIHETVLFAALEMGEYAKNGTIEIDIKEEEIPMVLDLVWNDYLPLFASEKFFPKELQEKAAKILEEQGKTTKKSTP